MRLYGQNYFGKVYCKQNFDPIEITNIESVVSHLSCLHVLLSVPFEICHIGFAFCAMSS